MPTNLPRMVRIHQKFPEPPRLDIPSTVDRQLTEKLISRIKPGARIAVAVGSRGITNLQQIVSVVVGWLKQNGAEPFVVSAMGSHGGATPEGQTEILAGYGISEQTLRVPVRASLDVELLGRTEDGVNVYFSSEALRADGIVVINRIKPHTDFSGSIGSGILKMITIGLGKRVGASTCHAAAVQRGYERVIRTVAGFSLRHAPVLGGVAILENQSHQTRKIVVLKNEEVEAGEQQLFEEARSLMPRLPFDDIDFLIVDRIGKNISGAGMDPNIIGRSVHGYSSLLSSESSASPRIGRIFVRDLAPESGGNAVGVGLADFTTSRLARAMDPRATYINSITSLTPLSAKIPMHFATDRETITNGLASLSMPDPTAARVVRIADTLSLDDLQASEAYMDLIVRTENLTLLGGPEEMKFDPSDNLLPL